MSCAGIHALSKRSTMHTQSYKVLQEEKDYQTVKKHIDDNLYKFSKLEIQNAIRFSNKIIPSCFGIKARQDVELIVKIIYQKEFFEVIASSFEFIEILTTSDLILRSGNEAECQDLHLLLRLISPFLSKDETGFVFNMFCKKNNYPRLLNSNFNILFNSFLDLFLTGSENHVSGFTKSNVRDIIILSFKNLENEQYNCESILKIICKIELLNTEDIEKLKDEPSVCYKISQSYLNDDLVKNVQKGVKWLKRASELNHAIALNDLGFLYLSGIYVDQNREISFSLFKKAAELGNQSACHNLGSLFRGDGVDYGIDLDIHEAIKWFTKGAHVQDVQSILALAHIYLNGEGGLSKNIYIAEHWFQEGKKLNDPISIYNLGFLYESNSAFDIDILKVKSLYEQAAALKSPKAMLLLAELHISGKLGKKDENKFIELLSEAAKLGDKEAIELLSAL